MRILEESDDNVSSNGYRSEVFDVEKVYTQFSDSDSETEEENQPRPHVFLATCC
jgi:hypothetical protein